MEALNMVLKKGELLNSNVTLIELPSIKDSRGELVVAEAMGSIPHEINRCYFIHNIPEGSERGQHAHYQCSQVISCIKGSCKLVVDDGTEKREFVLDQPNIGYLVGPFIWHYLREITSDALIMVYADAKYEEKDYIRDYETFLKVVGDFYR